MAHRTDLTARDGEHAVQFYSHDAALLDAVGSYLADAAQAGETAIVIAGEPRRRALAAELQARGIGPDELTAAGKLISLDAASLLEAFMRDGQIEHHTFLEVFGGLLRGLAGSEIRIYGEMVALLWDSGEVIAAIELERLWNELARECRFSLFCAYPAAPVSEEAEGAEACCLRSSVWHCAAPAEDLGHGVSSHNWLELQFTPDSSAPARARHLITDALSQARCDPELMDDVALVVSELVTNAVVHAGSAFKVSLKTGDSALRVTVQDAKPLVAVDGRRGLIVRHGHGLHVIGQLSTRWGVEELSGGKAVWAELLHDRTSNLVGSQ